MEMVEKFDNKRISLGKMEERHKKIPNEYRQSVHVWIINKNGEFLIQKRSANKKKDPNMWSVTGGANCNGETMLETVIRECKEEISIDVDVEKLELLMTIKGKSTFTDIWLLKQDIQIEDIKMQEDEVSDVKWVSREELNDIIMKGEFASKSLFYYEFLEKLLEFYNN